MVPENTNPPSQPLQPSDLTLDRSWRALKPGNYKPRTDLNEYKHPLIENLDQHKSSIPMGVADERSAVFIYPQGTIEVIGKVYCWNKLVKPGIYSPFEKLRYLVGNEIILNRDENSVKFHHASYDKFTIPANPFLTKEVFNNNEVLQYHFVSFDDQIVSSTGDKVYPIPILNGRLTIYPDGTFKTQGIVVESKENRYIDDYGYLADQDNYSTIESYYDGITKDDLNPKNVYKIISENSDGSITYGPIESNENIKRSRWIPLPEGIIPVNDGVVSITSDGEVELSGLVITKYGHRIIQRHFKAKDFKANSLNEQWVDKSAVYNPVGYSLHQDKFQSVVLDIVNNDDIIDTYRYHYYPESYTVNKLENDTQLIYRAMPGWDTFTTATPVKGSLAFLKEQIESYLENSTVDFTYYPWVNEFRIIVGGVYRYPFVRYNPEGKIDSYVSIDHYPLQWHFNDITNVEYHVNYFTHEDIEGNELELADEQPNYLTYPNYQNVEYLFPLNTKNKNKFIPYNGGKIWFTKNDQNQIMVNVQGSVIWQRGEHYYRIGLEDFNNKSLLNKTYTCLFDDSWPDIVEDAKGNIVSLFTVDGYFTDEPVFIKKKHALSRKSIGNELTSIRTWKRQEEGLFQLVERDITYYLTDYEKMLINNLHGQYRSFKINEDTIQIEEYYNYYLNVPYTAEQTGLVLDYEAIRFNDVLPNWFNPSYFSIDDYSDIGNNRNLSFERGKHQLTPYRPIRLSLVPNNPERKPKLELTLRNGNTFTLSHHYQIKEFELRRFDKDTLTLAENIDQLTYKDKVIYLDERSQEAIKQNTSYPVQQLAFLNRTLLRLPRSWVIENKGPVIRGSSTTRNRLILYRYYNDTKLISGSVVSDINGEFSINTPPIMDTRRGYIEVWLDDPFGVNKLGIRDTSYYFIELRNSNVLEPIIINNSESIDQLTTTITGTADPEAVVKIAINGVDQGVTLTVSEYGNWSWDCDLSEVSIGTTITATEEKEEFPSQSATAIVKEHLWKNGDFITPKQLFGDSMYMIPYNIRHKDNLDSVPNHIDSALTINPMNQTYTIHGVILSVDGNTIYPEGTYKIGKKPNAYTSKLITQDYVTSKHVQYTREHPTSPQVYRIGTTYKGSKNDPIKLPNTMVEIGQDELWLYPRSWLAEWETLSQQEDKLALPYFSVFAAWFTAKDFLNVIKSVRKEGSIGRFQNKIVLDEYVKYETITFDSLYLVQRAFTTPINGEHFGYRKDGYSALEYYQLLLLSGNTLLKPWFLNENLMGLPEGTNEPSIFIRKLPDHQSYTRPLNWRVKALATANEERRYTYNGDAWSVPSIFTEPYSMTLYHVHNWDHIVSNEIYRQEPYLVYYTVSYQYTLDKNYNEMERPMPDKIKEYWVNKGFDPNMFVFDQRKTPGTRIEFHKNGKTIDLHGRTKISGRYTKNIDQLKIKDKREIQFIQACPDAYIPHEDQGQVILTDNDEIVIQGIVYGLDCYQGVIRDRELQVDQNPPVIATVRSLNTDLNNKNWKWVSHDNQYMEIELHDISAQALEQQLALRITVTSDKVSGFISKWDETIEFNTDGSVKVGGQVATSTYDSLTKTLIVKTKPTRLRTVPSHGEYTSSNEEVNNSFELGVIQGDWQSLENNVLTTSVILSLKDNQQHRYNASTFIVKNGFSVLSPIELKFNSMVDNFKQYIIDTKGEKENSDIYSQRTFLVQINGTGVNDLVRIPIKLELTYVWDTDEKIDPSSALSAYRQIRQKHEFTFNIDLNNSNTEVLVNEPERAIIRIKHLNLRDLMWRKGHNSPWLITPTVEMINTMYYNINSVFGDIPLIGKMYRFKAHYTNDVENTPNDLAERVSALDHIYPIGSSEYTFILKTHQNTGKVLDNIFATNTNIADSWRVLASNSIEGDDNPRHQNYPYGWRDVTFVIENFPRDIDPDKVYFNLHSVCYNYIFYSENDGVVYDTPIYRDEHYRIEIDENWRATVHARINALGHRFYPLPRRRITDTSKMWTDNETYQSAEHYLEMEVRGYKKIRLNGMVDHYYFYHKPQAQGVISRFVVEDVEEAPNAVNVFNRPRKLSVVLENIPGEYFNKSHQRGQKEFDVSLSYETYLEKDGYKPELTLLNKIFLFNKDQVKVTDVVWSDNHMVSFKWELGVIDKFTPLENKLGYRENPSPLLYRLSHLKEASPYIGKKMHHLLTLNLGEHKHKIDIPATVEYHGKNVSVTIEQPTPNSYDNSLYSKSDYRYTFKNTTLDEIGLFEFTIMTGNNYIEPDGQLTKMVDGVKTNQGNARKYTYRININDPSVLIEKNDPSTKTIVLVVKGLGRSHPFLAEYKDDPWLIMPRMTETETAIYYQLNNEKPLLTL